MTRLAVHETIVPMARKGEDGLGRLQLAVETLWDHFEVYGANANTMLGPISFAAYADIRDVLKFLRMLLNPQEDAKVEAIDKIMKSKSGAKLLVAQVVTQQSYLAKRELRLRQQAMALLSYGAEMQKVLERLQGKDENVVSLSEINEMLAQLRVWRVALTRGQ